jgi:cbb3-type cytochrome oxidase maturation protein
MRRAERAGKIALASMTRPVRNPPVSVIYVLLPVATLLALAALWAFIRAARSGQFDDLETPAIRMLHDEDDPAPEGGEPRADGSGKGEGPRAS